MSRAMQFINQSKMKIQEIVKNETGILIDKPDTTGHGGNSNTRNVVRAILKSENRKLRTSQICNSEVLQYCEI